MQTKKIAVVIAGVFFFSHLLCTVPNFAGRLKLTFAGNCLYDLGKLSNWNTSVDIYLKRSGEGKWIKKIPLALVWVPIELACNFISRIKSRSNPNDKKITFYAKQLIDQSKKIEKLSREIQTMVSDENQEKLT